MDLFPCFSGYFVLEVVRYECRRIKRKMQVYQETDY